MASGRPWISVGAVGSNPARGAARPAQARRATRARCATAAPERRVQATASRAPPPRGLRFGSAGGASAGAP